MNASPAPEAAAERLAAIEQLHKSLQHGGGRGGSGRVRCTECGFPSPLPNRADRARSGH